MKGFLSSAALVALLAASPALAQDPMAQQPAPAVTKPADQGAQPAPDAGAAGQPADALPDTAQAPAPATQPTATAGDVKFLGQQAANQQLASTWMNKSVYNTADDNLGDVNDLVISESGQIDAVVLGVGGFLGIGEKSVAVPFSAVHATTDANGAIKLTFNATKEQLDTAPDFQTIADQKAKTQAQAETPAAPAPVQ